MLLNSEYADGELLSFNWPLTFCSVSCWRGLLAPPESGRVPGGSLGGGLLPVQTAVPRGNATACHYLRLQFDPNTHPKTEGDPGQRREDPSGSAAATAGAPAAEASGQHQGRQPAPWRPAEAGQESPQSVSAENTIACYCLDHFMIRIPSPRCLQHHTFKESTGFFKQKIKESQVLTSTGPLKVSLPPLTGQFRMVLFVFYLWELKLNSWSDLWLIFSILGDFSPTGQ